MNEQELYRAIDAQERGYDLSAAFPKLMRKVFGWMAGALLITALAAYVVATSPTLMQAIYGSKIVFWGIIIAELALVFSVSAAINRISLTTATVLFILYSLLNGATLAMIFYAFSTTVIVKTFVITAATFGAMALVGYTTKRDLSSLGRILFMALIGLIIATVVNLFVRSSAFDLIVSYIGVAIFIGLTAWDTQKIKLMLAQAPAADESFQKLALMGALTLYLDFINLFLYLLRIFGGDRD